MHILLHSLPPTLQQATTDPRLCWRLLDTSRQVWVSLLWFQCSFLLDPGAQRFCLCPPRVYFPLLCKFWQLFGGVNGDLLQEGLCHTQVCRTQSPCPCGWLVPPQDPFKHSSVSVSVGSLERSWRLKRLLNLKWETIKHIDPLGVQHCSASYEPELYGRDHSRCEGWFLEPSGGLAGVNLMITCI